MNHSFAQQLRLIMSSGTTEGIIGLGTLTANFLNEQLGTSFNIEQKTTPHYKSRHWIDLSTKLPDTEIFEFVDEFETLTPPTYQYFFKINLLVDRDIALQVLGAPDVWQKKICTPLVRQFQQLGVLSRTPFHFAPLNNQQYLATFVYEKQIDQALFESLEF